MLHEANLFNDALKYYQIALSYDSALDKIIENRIEILVNGILNNFQKYQANNELLLSIQSLKTAISLQPELSSKLSVVILKLENGVLEASAIKTQEKMYTIIEDSKFRGTTKRPDLIIGMTKDKAIEIIGMPDSIDFINSTFSSYEIWLYEKLNKRLYIKDERLYQIQSIEEE